MGGWGPKLVLRDYIAQAKKLRVRDTFQDLVAVVAAIVNDKVVGVVFVPVSTYTVKKT